ncbi:MULTISPECIES: YfiR family protein [unclassified Lentimicrobium]|uniref:YfiR family protein n=1 Tax=unclassified Lentimicrobium TaxID=2677434 RepID=UPI001552B0DE|nr:MULTISPECIES: YfiR family protein [unclassified Lentimicrobium]NPD44945.1 YfiR family protein [Lentimicrobium sp. S6]NPD85860.1 YfiR family protein [Lentimicrobium sp. L6]
MRQFPIHKILMVITFVVLTQFVFGQMSNYKSLYIYNFIKRIEWPIIESDENFHIVIYGDKNTYESILKIAETKLAGDRLIQVDYIDEVEDLVLADLIYVDYSKRKYIPEVASWIKNRPILLVSDYKNAKFTDINLFETSDGLEFIIRPELIRDKGLKLSDMLIQLGKIEIENQ